MHYLITGHTGFKGSWLTLLLNEMGHTVSGVSLDPEPVSLFNQASIVELLRHDIRADIREDVTMPEALSRCTPDVLIHMAAQPLVRESYRDPRLTIETNVMGTLNVLEAASAADGLRAQLIVTTDKVYRNVNRVQGYLEDEPLGGDDPYSASKAMADILTQSWVKSFAAPPTAIARAGNVIGGGDYSSERLIPDLIMALNEGRKVALRYPDAVRPWQHVLDCLSGYLAIVDYLLATPETVHQGEPWNIGPGRDSFQTVGDLCALAAQLWGASDAAEIALGDHPHEAGLLALDAAKAQSLLGWHNLLDFEESVGWTVDWYRAALSNESPQRVSQSQIRSFLDSGGYERR